MSAGLLAANYAELGTSVTPFPLRTFELEDFFVQYEHKEGLVNLASSDALPWTLREVTTLCPAAATALDTPTLSYPDLEELAPTLAARLGRATRQRGDSVA